jgi:hypothetical protein
MPPSFDDAARKSVRLYQKGTASAKPLSGRRAFPYGLALTVAVKIGSGLISVIEAGNWEP